MDTTWKQDRPDARIWPQGDVLCNEDCSHGRSISLPDDGLDSVSSLITLEANEFATLVIRREVVEEWGTVEQVYTKTMEQLLKIEEEEEEEDDEIIPRVVEDIEPDIKIEMTLDSEPLIEDFEKELVHEPREMNLEEYLQQEDEIYEEEDEEEEDDKEEEDDEIVEPQEIEAEPIAE